MFKRMLEWTTVEPTNATTIARTMIRHRPSEISNPARKEINEIAALKAEKRSNATTKNLIGVPSYGRNTTIKEQAQNIRRKEAQGDVTQIMTLIQTTMKTLTEIKSYFDEQQHTNQSLLGM